MFSRISLTCDRDMRGGPAQVVLSLTAVAPQVLLPDRGDDEAVAHPRRLDQLVPRGGQFHGAAVPVHLTDRLATHHADQDHLTFIIIIFYAIFSRI